MESKNITIGFDAAKLDALEFVLRKQRSSVQRRMEEVLQQLYESEVPEAVREYVDSKSAPAARPRRPAKASVEGRDYVIPDDVCAVFPDVCVHRLILNSKARLQDYTAALILQNVLTSVQKPDIREFSSK